MLGKLKKLVIIFWYFCTDNDNLMLYLMYLKACEILKGCYKFSISNTEDLEDLIFHIKTYLEIPKVLSELRYPEFKNLKINKILKRHKRKKLNKKEVLRFTNYLQEIEKQRAIERDFIFENAKVLTFGFDF